MASTTRRSALVLLLVILRTSTAFVVTTSNHFFCSRAAAAAAATATGNKVPPTTSRSRQSFGTPVAARGVETRVSAGAGFLESLFSGLKVSLLIYRLVCKLCMYVAVCVLGVIYVMHACMCKTHLTQRHYWVGRCLQPDCSTAGRVPRRTTRLGID